MTSPTRPRPSIPKLITRADWRLHLPLIVALGVCTSVWVVLFVMRVAAHQPNIDDFLYANVAYQLVHPSFADIVSNYFHTSPTAPLVPLLAALLTGGDSVNSMVAVQLPFFLLLVAGAYGLARTWLTPVASAAVAMVTGLNQAILGYTVMANFTVPIAAEVLWALICYLRSDRLRRWPWAIGFGVAVAAIMLSRSLAPVYVAPLIGLVAIDLVVDLVRNRHRALGPVIGAAAVVAVLAGPWWSVSAGTALHYLANTGYHFGHAGTATQTSTGLSFSYSAVANRLDTTLGDLGRVQQDAFRLLFIVSIVSVAFRWRRVNWGRAWFPVAWIVITFVALSVRANTGTGFGTPVLAVAIVMMGVGLLAPPAPPRWARGAVAGFVAAVLVFGLASLVWGGDSQAWLGPPYRQQIMAAGAARTTNVEQLTDQVAQAIGTTRTVMARNDPLVNVNGLSWALRGRATHMILPPYGSTGTASAIADLKHADALLTGGSIKNFQTVDVGKVQAAAFVDGYRAVREWSVGPENDVILMERPGPGSLKPLVHRRTATPKIGLKPGQVLSDKAVLLASSGDAEGLASVSFVITGPTLTTPLILRGLPVAYLWANRWDTSTVANGRYSVRGDAVSRRNLDRQSIGFRHGSQLIRAPWVQRSRKEGPQDQRSEESTRPHSKSPRPADSTLAIGQRGQGQRQPRPLL